MRYRAALHPAIHKEVTKYEPTCSFSYGTNQTVVQFSLSLSKDYVPKLVCKNINFNATWILDSGNLEHSFEEVDYNPERNSLISILNASRASAES